MRSGEVAYAARERNSPALGALDLDAGFITAGCGAVRRQDVGCGPVGEYDAGRSPGAPYESSPDATPEVDETTVCRRRS